MTHDVRANIHTPNILGILIRWLGSPYISVNDRKNVSKDKTYHILPKDEEARKIFLSKINRAQGNFPKKVFICSDHFEENCYNKPWDAQIC